MNAKVIKDLLSMYTHHKRKHYIINRACFSGKNLSGYY